MAGEYEKAISIKDAIDATNNRNYLLPAIHRKFVWSSHQGKPTLSLILQGVLLTLGYFRVNLAI